MTGASSYGGEGHLRNFMSGGRRVLAKSGGGESFGRLDASTYSMIIVPAINYR